MEIINIFWDAKNKQLVLRQNENTALLMKVAIDVGKSEYFQALLLNSSENIAILEMNSSPARFKALSQCLIMNLKLLTIAMDGKNGK